MMTFGRPKVIHRPIDRISRERNVLTLRVGEGFADTIVNP
eukprot:SAG31_NODE_606_length_13607_cov_17.509846_10_plen_40_part_00